MPLRESQLERLVEVAHPGSLGGYQLLLEQVFLRLTFK